MSSDRLISAAGFVVLLVAAISFGGVQVAVAQMPLAPQMPPIPQAPSAPQPPQPSRPDALQIPADGHMPSGGGAGAGATFVGAWCVGGDPAKQASISNDGAFLNLTNESGSTSMGNLQGTNQIVAPGWQFVTGTLSGNGKQINWSNGTSWSRCPSGGGGGGRTLSLNGNWYPNGNRSLQCSIQQHRGNLTLQNETGQRATGSFNGRRTVSTNWQGTQISGTVSADGNRIDWSNGTYWIRYRLY